MKQTIKHHCLILISTAKMFAADTNPTSPVQTGNFGPNMEISPRDVPVDEIAADHRHVGGRRAREASGDGRGVGGVDALGSGWCGGGWGGDRGGQSGGEGGALGREGKLAEGKAVGGNGGTCASVCVCVCWIDCVWVGNGDSSFVRGRSPGREGWHWVGWRPRGAEWRGGWSIGARR